MVRNFLRPFLGKGGNLREIRYLRGVTCVDSGSDAFEAKATFRAVVLVVPIIFMHITFFLSLSGWRLIGRITRKDTWASRYVAGAHVFCGGGGNSFGPLRAIE